uniref:Rhodanese domain-containing protein n=1 Tax=Chrysotila carterae TaxID=13221 RepID=A0A7S4FBN7_CHRCT
MLLALLGVGGAGYNGCVGAMGTVAGPAGSILSTALSPLSGTRSVKFSLTTFATVCQGARVTSNGAGLFEVWRARAWAMRGARFQRSTTHFPVQPASARACHTVSRPCTSVRCPATPRGGTTAHRRAHVLASGVQSCVDVIDENAVEQAKKQAVESSFPHRLEVDEFLSRAGIGRHKKDTPPSIILDVRSPCEYEKGHIPGAISFPLFTNEEREIVGTLYHKHGRDVAVKRGCKIVDESWRRLLSGLPPDVRDGQEVLVYCARGGMRSGGVAWLLSQAPLQVRVLEGGYKAFRNWAINGWERELPLVVLAGRTGSGKTDVLLELRDRYFAQVIDLEGDAQHRGSSFGALGRPPQPTSEHYENLLAVQWAAFVETQPVFIEDESPHVGRCGVPQRLYKQYKSEEATVLRLEVPKETRISRLVADYGRYSTEQLASCVQQLSKRLGGAKTAEAIAFLQEDPPKLAQVAELLLDHYYDGMYNHQASKRPGRFQHVLECDTADATTAAFQVLGEVATLQFEKAHVAKSTQPVDSLEDTP